MAVYIHSCAVDVAVIAFQTRVVRLDVGFFAVVRFSNQENTATFFRAMFDAIRFNFFERIALVENIIDYYDMSVL